MQRHGIDLIAGKPLSIAILAMGGQGGGVLAGWIVALAEREGWAVQSTSVPGVAQRTGATIYYVEMLLAQHGNVPVFSLMPGPGDVDIVLATEYMEAGRSMLRGLVTPGRTTLITSTHRTLAVAETTVPGDGVANSGVVTAAAKVAAKRVIAFDMQDIAERHGSVVSAAMFGALAGSDLLPFQRPSFEAVMRAGGRGIAASLQTFAAAFERSRSETPTPELAAPGKLFSHLPAAAVHPDLDPWVNRIRADYPPSMADMLFAGVRKLTDFQDHAYAGEYLDRMTLILRRDIEHGGVLPGYRFAAACAKYLAVAMSYDDVIRVADLKTRASRFGRVRNEMGVDEDQVTHVTEFMHPRLEEVLATLPVGMAGWFEARPRLLRWLDPLVNRGRRVRTDNVGWFLMLYLVAGLRRWRRGSLRHIREMAHLETWVETALAILPRNYDLAVEVIACRRLVKGYSDTHARGRAKFDRVLAAVPLLSDRGDGAAWLRRLREAALLDEEGKSLDGVLDTIATFAATAAAAATAGIDSLH